MTTHMSMTGIVATGPVLSRTDAGKAVCNFTVASSRTWQSGGVDQERTTLVDCTAFHELARAISATLREGMRVVVTGHLDHRVWSRADGSTGWKLECIVDEASPSLRPSK